MIAQAPTTSASPASPASTSGLPSAQTCPASGTTAPASESRSVARSGRVFRLLSARRARPKVAGPTRTASRAEEAVPGTPDVWLAGLRLGG
jgi:hypothetical protein